MPHKNWGAVTTLPDARTEAQEEDTAYLDAGPIPEQGWYIVINEEWVKTTFDPGTATGNDEISRPDPVDNRGESTPL